MQFWGMLDTVVAVLVWGKFVCIHPNQTLHSSIVYNLNKANDKNIHHKIPHNKTVIPHK